MAPANRPAMERGEKIVPIKAMHLKDGYKADHRSQYPKGTEMVYSNWTARSSKIPGINKVVFFGLQYFIKRYLIHEFNRSFFHVDKFRAVDRYKRRMDFYLGKDAISVKHIKALHDLGYLPIKILALQEGSEVPLNVPMLTIENMSPGSASESLASKLASAMIIAVSSSV